MGGAEDSQPGGAKPEDGALPAADGARPATPPANNATAGGARPSPPAPVATVTSGLEFSPAVAPPAASVTSGAEFSPGTVDPRPQFGYELARHLLIILAGTILLFWFYILVLDLIQTGHVSKTYQKIIAGAEPALNSPEIRSIDGAIATFRDLQRSPPPVFPVAVREQVLASIQNMELGLRPAQVEALKGCAQLMLVQPASGTQPEPRGAAVAPSGPQPQPSGAAVPPPEPAPQPSAEVPPSNPPVPEGADRSPETSKRNADVEACMTILASVRYAIGGPMDTDRLRVMRDFAKDVHDNHQGLRTFWISAAQLVLINVLLPLLTALLGYIFGRQSNR